MFARRLSSVVYAIALAAPVALVACAGYESDGTSFPAGQPEPATDPTSTVTTPGGTTSDTNVTGDYALTVKGTTPANMANKMVYAALFDANGLVIGNANTMADTGGFTLSFAGKLNRGASYSVAYYIDRNGNGFCNIADANDPNADVGYTVNANAVTGNTSVSSDAAAMGNTFVCNHFGSYGFLITGQDYGPHNGSYVFVALMDKADNTFVAGPLAAPVLNATWRFSFPSVLLAGHTYEARYFIDQNHSDKCEDHSWVSDMTAPASGDTEMTVKHGQTQSPVCSNYPVTLPKD